MPEFDHRKQHIRRIVDGVKSYETCISSVVKGKGVVLLQVEEVKNQ